MSLLARHLESNGISTVVIGSAMDIVVHCGVPRYLHTDFPLGNPCGKPYDSSMQSAIVSQALHLVAESASANSIARAPFSWGDDQRWRDQYLEVNAANRQQLAAIGEQRRRLQARLKTGDPGRAPMLPEDQAGAS